MKLKKMIAALLCAMLTLGAFAGCGGKDADGLKEITVVLDWTPNTNHTGMYVALQKGWYEEAGLKVKIVQPPEDGALSLLASGKAQFAVSVQEEIAVAIAGDSPLPVKAVASIVDHNTSGIISLKSTGIKSARDLEGKRYASWSSPFEEATLRTLMDADGGTYEKIELIPNAATDLISALQTDIDAAWIFYGWDGIACEIAGLEFDYIDLREFDEVFDFYTPVLAAGEQFLESDPETARAFLEATARGYDFAIENPEAAADILVGEVPEIDRDLAVASQNYLAGQYKAEKEQWGTIDATRWDNFYAWMYEKDLLESDITGKGFTNDYLPK